MPDIIKAPERARVTAHKRALLGSSVLVASAMFVGLALPQAVLAADAAAQSAPSTVKEVVVTGTFRTDRTVTNSASPVDVISSTDLVQQPAANMLDQLKTIVPSFFVGQNTISDASSLVRAPSLRGLPGDEVLVMLNGKRYNRSALVQVYTGGDTGLSFGSQSSDLSAIPAIAIGNLQVLRDGATAQYGSDAIAGVLNYGLKNDRRGLEVDGQYGQYYRNGDGTSREVSANLGLGFGPAFLNVSGEYDNEDGTSRGATRPNAVIFAQLHPDLAKLIPNYPGPAQIWGSSPTYSYKLLANGGIQVTPQSELYVFGNYAWTHTDESFNYRPPNAVDVVDSSGVLRHLGANGALSNTFYLTPCPANNLTCPAGGFVKDANTFSFLSIYPAGFTPRFIGVIEEKFGVVGYKGKLDSGFTYDLSGSLSENSVTLSMNHSLSPTYGPASQTSFTFGDLIQKEANANLDIGYPLQVPGFASPVTLTGGFEFRHENYSQTAGDAQSFGVGPYAVAQQLFVQVSPGVYAPAGHTDAQSPGASGYGGTSPNAAGSWSQSSYGFYADAEGDPIERLSLGAAIRFEHYDTFGSTVVWKLNGIYHFSDAFALRATVGTGFHAPSPGQSNDEILTTNFVNGAQVQTGTYPVSSPIAKFFGATTLKPEKSTNFGIGIVAKPTPSTVITVDGYYIKVTSRIGITQNFKVTAADILAQPALEAVGVDGAVNFFTNGFDTETHGIDVVATHHIEVLDGRLALTLAYNWNASTVTKSDPHVISPAQIIDVEHLAPNHRVSASAAWSRGRWFVNLRENFYGPWRDEVDYPGQQFGSKFVTDFDVNYAVNNHLTVTAGAANLFNAYPDKIAQSDTNPVYPLTGGLNDGQVYPRNGGPFGINGGFWYVRVKARY